MVFYNDKKKAIKYTLKEKILKLLIENKREWTILEIAKVLKTDYKNTFQEINQLSQTLLKKHKKGNTNLIEVNLSQNIVLCLLENKRTAEFLSNNKKISLIKEDIERINYPFIIIILFGSAVKMESTGKSDLDVCIISDNPEKTKEVISNIHLYPQKFDIQQFTSSEFESMLNKQEDNLAKEIVKRNIILFGVENYYNLISKWMKKD